MEGVKFILGTLSDVEKLILRTLFEGEKFKNPLEGEKLILRTLLEGEKFILEPFFGKRNSF